MSSAELHSTCENCRQALNEGALFCPMCGAPRTRRDTDPLVGEVVADRWLLRERLGHGGSGTIYLAEHVTLRRKVALKVLHHELSRDDMAMERFRREAVTVGEIDNEHIVEVHDFGRTRDGRLFLAMELLDGETLADAIASQGRLPIAMVVDVLVQLGEALMEAHAMGYVHRDLRPRNVFLTRRKNRERFVKLLDFGLAKLVEQEGEAASTSLGMTFGDPRYMSPEQARGEAIDRRADLYSLGVIAYEMLTGKPPFVGKKVFDVLTQHLEAPPPSPSQVRGDVPAWLEAVVLRMLAKRPDERFVTVYRLVEALRDGQAKGTIMSADAAQSMPLEIPPPPAPRTRETGVVRVMPVAAIRDEARRDPAISSSPAAASGEMSGAWFADSQAIPREDVEPSDSPSRPRTPTPIPSSASSSSEVYLPAQRLRWKPWAIAAGVLIAAFLAIALWPREKRPPAPVAAALPDAAPAVAPPPPAAPVDAGVAPRPQQPSRPSRLATTPPPPRRQGGGGVPPPELPADLRNLLGKRTPDAGAAPPSRDPAVSDEGRARAEFFVKLGQNALASGDLGGASANFNKARGEDNRNPDAIAGLGEVALRQSQYSAATVHFDAAARLAPRSARIQTLRGQAWLGAGDPRKAAAAFKAALKADPDNAAARRGYEEAARQGGE